MALGAAFVVLDQTAKRKQPNSVYENHPDEQNPMEGKRVVFVENNNETENADGKCGHLEAIGNAYHTEGKYEKKTKRILDKILSFGGLVLLSPLMGCIAIAIKIEDPGPIIFTQKRVGKNKQYFKLHKFRSMKMSTPHDVPTHMLEDPDQYITKVGKFLRKHSLDELPQIWDIFIGNMSIVGPRPALWNQDVLVSERERYNANDIKPGLTGLAQINGRDELEIAEKAKWDGVYTQALAEDGQYAVQMDTQCFLKSIPVFSEDKNVVEGGTGELVKEKTLRNHVPVKDPKEYFGCDYEFDIDMKAHKNVLIVGADSYIGKSFVSYAKKEYEHHFSFTTIDTIPDADGTSALDRLSLQELSRFDIVYHLAGIAHADIDRITDEEKEKYYQVNTDLAISTAEKCKQAGVKCFIFMSSMIVYGDSGTYKEKRNVTKDTIPSPSNFYGDSKWQADKGLRALADEQFHVCIIRPPMIYGKGAKGNYLKLSQLARITPVFPYVNNQRSMLYIDNLCEFLCQLMLSTVTHKDKPNSLIFMPQNSTYTNTAEMVQTIGSVHHHPIFVTGIFDPLISIGNHGPEKIKGLINKAFGNNCYDQLLSIYRGINYQKYAFIESIRQTES